MSSNAQDESRISAADLYDMDRRILLARAKRERNLKKKSRPNKDNPDETIRWSRNTETGRLEKFVSQNPLRDKPASIGPPMIPFQQRTMFDRWVSDVFNPPPSHPSGWHEKDHYMHMGWCWCGQSCPCCRAKVGDKLGACEICIANRPNH